MGFSKMLLESAGTYGFGGGVSSEMASRYSAEHGDQIIAMESMQTDHEIFESMFYDIEVAEFQSIMEGFGGGTPVTEGIGDKIKGGIAKIKEALQKLWTKVKAWFHNVKRYLDGIFMDGVAFANKYKSELEKLELSGFKFAIFDYDVLTGWDKLTTTYKAGGDDFSKVSSWATDSLNSDKGEDYARSHKVTNPVNSEVDSTGTLTDDNKKSMLSNISRDMGLDDKNPTDLEELRKNVWSAVRGKASYGSEAEEVEITSLSPYITKMQKTKDTLQSINKTNKALDDRYRTVLSDIDKAEKALKAKVTDTSVQSEIASGCRKLYNETAFVQTALNAVAAELRSANAEEVKKYKALFMKALAYKKPKDE